MQTPVREIPFNAQALRKAASERRTTLAQNGLLMSL